MDKRSRAKVALALALALIVAQEEPKRVLPVRPPIQARPAIRRAAYRPAVIQRPVFTVRPHYIPPMQAMPMMRQAMQPAYCGPSG